MELYYSQHTLKGSLRNKTTMDNYYIYMKKKKELQSCFKDVYSGWPASKYNMATRPAELGITCMNA